MIERNLLKDNNLRVVGIVTDVSSNISTSKKGQDFIRGKITVNVRDRAIDLNFFAMKLTKANTVNKMFESYSTLNELIGQRVQINGYIDESKFVSGNSVRHGNSLYARFINVVGEGVEDEATFKVTGFIQEGLKAVYEDDGATVKDYNLVLGQATYNNSSAKLFHFNVDKTNVAAISSINERFTVGVTATLCGDLDFDVETKKQVIEQDFGPALTKTSQRSIRRYVVTSGSLVADDMAYTPDEISELLANAQTEDQALINSAANNSNVGIGVPVTSQPTVRASTAQPKLI